MGHESRDEDDEEVYGGKRLLGFMFGNVDNLGDLDVDYLDEDAKEHLSALSDKLGLSLNLDMSEKSRGTTFDASEQDYDMKAEDAVNYEDIDEEYDGPEVQTVTEEDLLLSKIPLNISNNSLFDDENYDALESENFAADLENDLYEDEENSEEAVCTTSSTTLPVLCMEDGMVILRFSKIFGIHEPPKKKQKRDSISKDKYKRVSMDITDIAEEDEEAILKRPLHNYTLTKQSLLGAQDEVTLSRELSKDAEPMKLDIQGNIPLNLRMHAPYSPKFSPLDQQDWENKIIWDNSNSGSDDLLNGPTTVVKKFTLQNQDILNGSWLDGIIWEAPQNINKPKLILDLQDEQMVFEVLDSKYNKHLQLHARAMLIPPCSTKHMNDNNTHKERFNIANDIFYSNMKQLKSNLKNRSAHGLKVLHSIPALKLQTMKPKLSNKDMANFHRPKAKWYPHNIEVPVPLKEPTNQGTMKIIVKSLGGKGIKLNVDAEETVNSIKAKASKKLDFKLSEPVKIIYSRRELDNNISLSAQNVGPNSLLHLVRTKIHLLPQSQKLPGQNKSFKKKSHLSGKDGHIFLMEYSEERPLLLGNAGMGARLCTYYKKSGPDDQTGTLMCNESKGLGSVIPLDLTDKSPFLGDIKPGFSQSSIETNMYRAPIFQHKVPTTDYLLIRSAKGKLYIRRIDRINVVGQQEPHMEVISPGSKGIQTYKINRLLVYLYREFRAVEKLGLRPFISVDHLSAQFPSLGQPFFRRTLKDCADLMRDEKNKQLIWCMRQNFRIPLEEELRRMVTPENVCAYESMQVGVYRLKQLGITKLTLPNGLASAMNQLSNEEITSHIERELQITPWNLTSNFVACTKQENMARLEISGVGDPSGRGLGFSYVRFNTKKKGTGVKYVCGERISFVQLQQQTREKCQEIWDQQFQSLVEENENENNDLDSFAGDLENLLDEEECEEETNRVFHAEEEIEDEAAELSRILMDDEEAHRKKKMKKIKDGLSENADPNIKEENFPKEKTELPKAKILGDGLKMIKQKKPTREAFACGACGQPGHMKTNKNCPMYRKNPEKAASKFNSLDKADPKKLVQLKEKAGKLKCGPEENRVDTNKKMKCEDIQVESLVIRPLMEPPKKKIIIKQPKDIIVNQEERRKINKDVVTRQLREEREEEQRRKYTERAKRVFKEEEMLGEITRYEQGIRMEREEEERQKAFKKKQFVFDNMPHRRNDPRILERTKRRLPQLSFASPAKRTRGGGEVVLSNILGRIVETLMNRNDISYLFLKPVSNKEAPDYLDIIEEPMDLSTIRDKVRNIKYKSREDFRHDVCQIAINAHTYNDTRYPLILPLADQLLELCDYLLDENHLELDQAETTI